MILFCYFSHTFILCFYAVIVLLQFKSIQLLAKAVEIAIKLIENAEKCLRFHHARVLAIVLCTCVVLSLTLLDGDFNVCDQFIGWKQRVEFAIISAITTFGEILLHLWLELVICILTSHLFDLIDQRVALVTMALYFKSQTCIVDWDKAVFFVTWFF